MKKTILATFVMGAFISSGVNAELLRNSLSLGYAQSNVNASMKSLYDNPRGINIKYRFELNDNLGFVSSFVYTRQGYDFYYAGRKVGDAELDYYSLSAGPVYRINNYVSVYGLLGAANGRAESHLMGDSASERKTSAVFGAGLQFNPFPNWVVDASYEYTKLGGVKFGTWMTGIGYRF